MAARYRSKARSGSIPSSPCACRPGRRHPLPQPLEARRAGPTTGPILRRHAMGQTMSFSILIVDDEPDVAELFRQRFRREMRQGTYVMHFAASGADALDRLSEAVQPTPHEA